MSTSHECEQKLRDLSTDLHDKAYELEKAADVLAILRNEIEIDIKIKDAKEWAKRGMK